MFDITRLMQDFGSKETNQLAAELKEILEQSKFDIRSPIEITNRGSGPVFDIIQRGVEQHRVIAAVDETGAVVELGIGAGSRGVNASEFVPDPNFSLDPTAINEVFSTQGNNPRDPSSSLLEHKRSGTGVPHEKKPYVPVAGWADALAGLHKSNDTEHAPDAAVALTRDGQHYWWPTKPEHWHLVRATITSINTDTLTCAIVANGKCVAENVTVARNCYLQRTPWDGETIDGIEYTYTDNQTRTANDGVTSETQTIVPAYYTAGSLYDPCGHIYITWVGNETDVSGVGWVEVLPHRVWAV